MFVEQRSFWTIFGIALSAFLLYGPVVGRPDHNVYRYLLGPLLCPAMGAIYFILWPFNPYKSSDARTDGLFDYDESDKDAKQLVEVFRSKDAQKFVRISAIKLSGTLFFLMPVAMLALRHWLNWSFPSPWLGPGLIGGCIGSFIATGSEYLSWGVTTWSSSDTASISFSENARVPASR
jgi:hypothetical protein